MANWRKIPEAGTVWGIRALVTFARIFGRTIAGWFLYLVAMYYASFHGVARRASRDYLQRIGEPSGFWASVRHIHMFAQVSLDRLFFLTGKFKSFDFSHKGHELIMEAAKSGRGLILVGAHIGSFEAMRGRAKAFGVPISIVVDWSNSERMNSVLRSLAPDIDTRLISLVPDPLAAMLAIREAITRGEMIAILGDRLPDARTGNTRTVKAEFLGQPAAFPAGPWLLAHSLKCPVYFVAGLYTKPNHYALHFELLAEEVKLDRKDREAALERYAQTYASMLETHARSAPLNWFNFFDFWSTHE